MTSPAKRIQLKHGSELEALAAAVYEDHEMRVLERDGKPIAAVVALGERDHGPLVSPSPEAIAKALSVAGAWKDVDTDSMIEEIYKARHESPSRVVEI